VLLARVAGQVWGARQADGLRGCRLLVLQPLSACPLDPTVSSISITADAPGLREAASVIVAVDALGAGPGELVLVAHGSRCRDLTLGEEVPTKDVVVAIVDEGALYSAGPGARCHDPG
jgi:ethanolamine utilization protein EutN